MKIKIGKLKKEKQIKNCFVLSFTTMQGDADDYHYFKFIVEKKDKKKLRRLIIYANVLLKSYPHGKGGYDDFSKLSFFEDWFSDEWYNYEGFVDSMESFSIDFIDKKGGTHSVSYELSKKDKKTIDSYPVLTY